jgi:hypothetical protein
MRSSLRVIWDEACTGVFLIFINNRSNGNLIKLEIVKVHITHINTKIKMLFLRRYALSRD